MGLPASAVDICKLALDQIGESSSSVNSIDPPDSDVEELVARNYDTARQSVLFDFPWNCAKKLVAVTRNGTPITDYADSYGLPNDYVRLLSVGGETEIQQTQDYDVQGRNLFVGNVGAAATNSVEIRYIYDNTDVTTWSAGFRDIVILTLALQLAYAFTKKKSVVEHISALIDKRLPGALSADGQEVRPKRIQYSKTVAARRQSGSSYYADRYITFSG